MVLYICSFIRKGKSRGIIGRKKIPMRLSLLFIPSTLLKVISKTRTLVLMPLFSIPNHLYFYQVSTDHHTSPPPPDKRARSILTVSKYIFSRCRYRRPRAESFIIDISCQPRGLYTRIIEYPYIPISVPRVITILHRSSYRKKIIGSPTYRILLYLTFDLHFKISSLPPSIVLLVLKFKFPRRSRQYTARIRIFAEEDHHRNPIFPRKMGKHVGKINKITIEE